jgi:transcriptional regulator with XRE-family HTH domain
MLKNMSSPEGSSMSKLKLLRVAKDLSQIDLAESSGVSRSAIQWIEQGNPMRVGTAKKLAQALDVDWRIFFEEDAQKTERSVQDVRPGA